MNELRSIVESLNSILSIGASNPLVLTATDVLMLKTVLQRLSNKLKKAEGRQAELENL